MKLDKNSYRTKYKMINNNKLGLSRAKLSSAGVEFSFVLMFWNEIGQHSIYT